MHVHIVVLWFIKSILNYKFRILRSVLWIWKSFGLRVLCFHCISSEWWVKKGHGLVHGFLKFQLLLVEFFDYVVCLTH